MRSTSFRRKAIPPLRREPSSAARVWDTRGGGWTRSRRLRAATQTQVRRTRCAPTLVRDRADRLPAAPAIHSRLSAQRSRRGCRQSPSAGRVTIGIIKEPKSFGRPGQPGSDAVVSAPPPSRLRQYCSPAEVLLCVRDGFVHRHRISSAPGGIKSAPVHHFPCEAEWSFR